MGNEIIDLGNLVCVAIKSLSCFALGRFQKSFSCVFDGSLAHSHTLFSFEIIVYVARAGNIKY
jgi:hypothetical protein